MAEQGLRILGVAVGSFLVDGTEEYENMSNKEIQNEQKGTITILFEIRILNLNDLHSSNFSFQFLGLLGFEDPVRVSRQHIDGVELENEDEEDNEGVAESISQLHKAGIKVVLISGDIGATAKNIAQQVGIPSKRVITGNQIEMMNDFELARAVGLRKNLDGKKKNTLKHHQQIPKQKNNQIHKYAMNTIKQTNPIDSDDEQEEECYVFARILPEQKLRIVRAFQNNGLITGMIGDGVNDAPALKAADIGIAMGGKGVIDNNTQEKKKLKNVKSENKDNYIQQKVENERLNKQMKFKDIKMNKQQNLLEEEGKQQGIINTQIAFGGRRGTDVARNASDIILLDDNFSSLVTACKTGRRIFSNIQNAVVYILAVHIPFAGLALIPVLLNWPVLLYPVHIVFAEMIIDPACSIVFEMQQDDDDDIFMRPPRRALSSVAKKTSKQNWNVIKFQYFLESVAFGLIPSALNEIYKIIYALLYMQYD
ncbi:MAG: putative cation-translocating P-type ATPase [Streblomastix strix]|uniref:Putative cation-translocating P-type ATPase n=1 Tax=Streblomastix strix TaxID=222440 RepID=A0A5J4WN28_9EUKA|nr:MAG: putative cation-translocating P-type ATPase [Streblomastix strix]